MNTDIGFHISAFKHNINEADIRHAFIHSIFDHPVAGEEEKNLLIGFDSNANLLEILYNVDERDQISVFHAMRCRKNWYHFANQ